MVNSYLLSACMQQKLQSYDNYFALVPFPYKHMKNLWKNMVPSSENRRAA